MRLIVVAAIAGAVVVSVTLGLYFADVENPYAPPVHYRPTPFSLQIKRFHWTPDGCGLTNYTASGGFYVANSTVNQSIDVYNHNASAACNVESLTLDPSEFRAASTNVPLSIAPHTTVAVRISIEVPAYYPPTNLTIAIVCAFAN